MIGRGMSNAVCWRTIVLRISSLNRSAVTFHVYCELIVARGAVGYQRSSCPVVFSCLVVYSETRRLTAQDVRPDLHTVFWRDGCLFSHGFQRPWSSLWNCKVRHRNSSHVRYAARTDHEVHHPCSHGGYHRYLRSSGGCPNRQRHQPGRIHPLQELRASRCRIERRLERVGSGLRDRGRGRFWRERNGSATSALRRHDPHPHLRRSVGSVRTHRGPHPFDQVRLASESAASRRSRTR